MGEIFLAMKFFLGTPNDVSWKFRKSEIKDISLYIREYSFGTDVYLLITVIVDTIFLKVKLIIF